MVTKPFNNLFLSLHPTPHPHVTQWFTHCKCWDCIRKLSITKEKTLMNIFIFTVLYITPFREGLQNSFPFSPSFFLLLSCPPVLFFSLSLISSFSFSLFPSLYSLPQKSFNLPIFYSDSSMDSYQKSLFLVGFLCCRGDVTLDKILTSEMKKKKVHI